MYGTVIPSARYNIVANESGDPAFEFTDASYAVSYSQGTEITYEETTETPYEPTVHAKLNIVIDGEILEHGAENDFTAGYINTTSAVDAIDFKMDSGKFDGTIKMYGLL